eukprot:jgi/Mesvir1/18580/Mv17089-RA.1
MTHSSAGYANLRSIHVRDGADPEWRLYAGADGEIAVDSMYRDVWVNQACFKGGETNVLQGDARALEDVDVLGNVTLPVINYATAPDSSVVSKEHADLLANLSAKWDSRGVAGVTYGTGTPAHGEALTYTPTVWVHGAVPDSRRYTYTPPAFGVKVADDVLFQSPPAWADVFVGSGTTRNMFANESAVQLQKIRFSLSNIPQGESDGYNHIQVSIRVLDLAVDTSPYAGEVYREVSTADVTLDSIGVYVDGQWVIEGGFDLSASPGGVIDIAQGTGFRMQIKVSIQNHATRVDGFVTGSVRVYGKYGVTLPLNAVAPSSAPTISATTTSIQITHNFAPTLDTGNIGVVARLYDTVRVVSNVSIYENTVTDHPVASCVAPLTSVTGEISSLLTFQGLTESTQYYVYLVAKSAGGQYSNLYGLQVKTLATTTIGENGVPDEMVVIDPGNVVASGPGEGQDFIMIDGTVYRLTNGNPDSGYQFDLSQKINLDQTFTVTLNLTIPTGSFDPDPTHNPNTQENVYFYIGSNGAGASDNNTSIAMGTYNGGVWFKVADQDTATFANDVGIESALNLHPGSPNRITITRAVEEDGDAVYTWRINGTAITGNETYQGNPVFVYHPQYEGAYPVFGTKTTLYPDGTPNNTPLGGQTPVGEYLSNVPPTLTNTSTQVGASGGLTTNTGGTLPDLTLNTSGGVLQGNTALPDPAPLGNEQGVWTFASGDGRNTGSVSSTSLVTHGTFTVSANQQLQANLASGTTDYATIDLSNAAFNGGLNTFTLSVDYQHPGNLVGNLDNGAIAWYGNASSYIGLYHGGDGYLHLKTSSGDIATTTMVSDGASHNIVLSRLTQADGGTVTTTTTTPATTWQGDWSFDNVLTNGGTGTSGSYTATGATLASTALTIPVYSGANKVYVLASDMNTTRSTANDGFGACMIEVRAKTSSVGNTGTCNVFSVGQDYTANGGGNAYRVVLVGSYFYIQTEYSQGNDYSIKMLYTALASLSGSTAPNDGNYHVYRLARKAYAGPGFATATNLFQFWYDGVEILMTDSNWVYTTPPTIYCVQIKSSDAYIRLGNVGRFTQQQGIVVDYVKFKNDIAVPGQATTTTTYNGMYRLYVDGSAVTIPSAPPDLGNVTISTKTLTFGEDSQWGFNDVSRSATWDNIRFLNRSVTGAEVTKLSDANPQCPQYYQVTNASFPDLRETFAVSVDYCPPITSVPSGTHLSGVIFDYGDPNGPSGTQPYVRIRHDDTYHVTIQVYDGSTMESYTYSTPFTYGTHNFLLERVSESSEWRLYVDGQPYETVAFSGSTPHVHDANITNPTLSVGWKLSTDSIQNAQWDNLRVFSDLPSDSVLHVLGDRTYQQPDNPTDTSLYLYGDAAGNATTVQAGNGYGQITVTPAALDSTIDEGVNLPVFFPASQSEPSYLPSGNGASNPASSSLSVINPITGAASGDLMNTTVISTASSNISNVYATGITHSATVTENSTWIGDWEFNDLTNTGPGLSSSFISSTTPSGGALTIPVSTGNNTRYVKAVDLNTSGWSSNDGYGAFTVEMRAKTQAVSDTKSFYLFSIGQDFTTAGGGYRISLRAYTNAYLCIDTEISGGAVTTLLIPSTTIRQLANTASLFNNGAYHTYKLTRKSYNDSPTTAPTYLFRLWFDDVEIPLNHPSIGYYNLYNVPIKSEWAYIRVGHIGRASGTEQAFVVDYLKFKNDTTTTSGGVFRELIEVDVGTNLGQAMVTYYDPSFAMSSGTVADYQFSYVSWTDAAGSTTYHVSDWSNKGAGTTGSIFVPASNNYNYYDINAGNYIILKLGGSLYVTLSADDWTPMNYEVTFTVRIKVIRNADPRNTYLVRFGDPAVSSSCISLMIKQSDRKLYVNETTAISGVSNLDDSAWHTYVFTRKYLNATTDSYTLTIDGIAKTVPDFPKVTISKPTVTIAGYDTHVDTLTVSTPIVTTVVTTGSVYSLLVGSTLDGAVNVKQGFYTKAGGFQTANITSFTDAHLTSMSKLWLANTRDTFGHWKCYVSASAKKPDRLSEMTPVTWTVPDEVGAIHSLRLGVSLNDKAGTGVAYYDRDYITVRGHIYGSYQWDNDGTYVFRDSTLPATNSAVEGVNVTYSNKYLKVTKLSGSGTDVFWRDYLPNGKWYIEFDLAYTPPTATGSVSFGVKRFDSGTVSFKVDHASATSGTYGVAVDLLGGTGRLWTRSPTGAWTNGDPATGTGGIVMDTLSTQWWLFLRLPDNGIVTTRTLPSRSEQSPVTHAFPAGFSWYTYTDNVPERRSTFGVVYPTLTQYSSANAAGVMSLLNLNDSTAADPYLALNGSYKSVTASSSVAGVLTATKSAALVTDLVLDGAFSLLWKWEGVAGGSPYLSGQTISFVQDIKPLLVDTTLTVVGNTGVSGWYQNSHTTASSRKAVAFVSPTLYSGTTPAIQYAGSSTGSVVGRVTGLTNAAANPLWVAFTRDSAGVMGMYFSSSATRPSKLSSMVPGSTAVETYQAPPTNTSSLRIVLSHFDDKSKLSLVGYISSS